jgi:hypothetical protein
MCPIIRHQARDRILNNPITPYIKPRPSMFNTMFSFVMFRLSKQCALAQKKNRWQRVANIMIKSYSSNCNSDHRSQTPLRGGVAIALVIPVNTTLTPIQSPVTRNIQTYMVYEHDVKNMPKHKCIAPARRTSRQRPIDHALVPPSVDHPLQAGGARTVPLHSSPTGTD